jgi:hypothetical protein
MLVPAIVVFSIFISENGRLSDYTNSIAKNKMSSIHSSESNSCKDEENGWHYAEDLFDEIVYPLAPSKKILKDVDFFIYHPSSTKSTDARKLLYKGNNITIAGLCLSLILLGITILNLSSFFTGRFKELSELSRKTRELKSPHLTIMPVFPPFNKDDLIEIEKSELGIISGYIYPSSIDNPGVSQHQKLTMIFSKAMELHKLRYAKIWHSLSDDEKFVLYDFAIDYFVNNRNKMHLISLINKSLIIEDPVTGRLRMMNYGFRNFVIWYEKKDPAFSAEEMETNIKGNFAKWRLPLFIIAISLLFLISYIYKEQCDRIFIVGGSTLSTIGLITKFLNNYKGK